jgi:hypothetical protein
VRDALQEIESAIQLVPNIFPRPDFDAEKLLLAVLLCVLIGLSLEGGVARRGGGEDKFG